MLQFEAKSVVVSRKPGKDADGLWNCVVALFDENNPHLKARVPFKSLEFEEVVKVRLHELENVSFYLIGNDLVINNLTRIDIDFDESRRIITLSGEQNF